MHAHTPCGACTGLEKSGPGGRTQGGTQDTSNRLSPLPLGSCFSAGHGKSSPQRSLLADSIVIYLVDTTLRSWCKSKVMCDVDPKMLPESLCRLHLFPFGSSFSLFLVALLLPELLTGSKFFGDPTVVLVSAIYRSSGGFLRQN